MTPRESFQKLDDLLSVSINRQNDKLSKVLADAVSKARKIRLNYKTTMQTGIKCKENPFIRVYWIQHASEVELDLL